jgi:hypothetical protein
MPSKQHNHLNQVASPQSSSVAEFSHTDWLTTKQAATYANTAVSTFRTWDITKYRPNKHNLYRKADIDAYIEQFVCRSNAVLSAALESKRQILSLSLGRKR